MNIYTVTIHNIGKHTSNSPDKVVAVSATSIETALVKVQRDKKHRPQTAERVCGVELLCTVDVA